MGWLQMGVRPCSDPGEETTDSHEVLPSANRAVAYTGQGVPGHLVLMQSTLRAMTREPSYSTGGEGDSQKDRPQRGAGKARGNPAGGRGRGHTGQLSQKEGCGTSTSPVPLWLHDDPSPKASS